MPWSVEELSPAKAWTLIDQLAISTVEIDRRFDAKDLFPEGGNDIGRYPRRAETSGDVGGLEAARHDLFERCNIAAIPRSSAAAAWAAVSLSRILPER